MKLKDIEQSEELKACREALKMLAPYWKVKHEDLNDYIMQCYFKILEANKNQKLSHDDMKKIAVYELAKLHKTDIKYNNNMFELPDEQYQEGENNSILATNILDETLGFNTLKKCFNDFFKNSSYNKQFIIDKLFNKENASTVAKKYKIATYNQTELIYKFRRDFLNYLVKVGYFESSNNFKIEKFSKRLIKKKIYSSKKLQGNSFDYGQYPNDLKVYKLIRNNIKNINEFAKDIFMIPEKLKCLIEHRCRTGCGKLRLYQINILRKKYFNDYTLEELAN